MASTTDSDICIIGGGLVGLTAAIALSYQGRSVRLIESNDLGHQVPAELDARSIALSWSSIQIFRSLGLWQNLNSLAAPISHIHVSSAGHFGVSRLSAQDLELDAMGYVIEYHLLIQYLQDLVEQDPAIDMLSPVQLESLDQYDNGVTVHCRMNGVKNQFETRLLLVADGGQSRVREQLEIEIDTFDFRQSAIIANIRTEQPADSYAYERFTSEGPLALLPLPRQRYAMVWTHTPERAESLMTLSDEEFFDQLYKCFGYRLGYFEELGSRARFDLKLTRAKQLVRGRCILIGNAANTLHPVAGQGFNLALRDIGVLFDTLTGAKLQSDVIPIRLEQYAQQRGQDQSQSVRLSSLLVQLFSNDLPVLNHVRAAALAALDICPLIKQEVSWQGMGYGDGCSSLMRGKV